MIEFNLLQKIVLWAIPIIFAITVHEVAHGWVASKLGDPTAKMLGRLTLNPIKHIDPIGTIIVPGILLFLGGFIFGWAKPVPVTWANLKHPKRDMCLVAIAGPAANLLMALIWVVLLKFGIQLKDEGSTAGFVLANMAYIGVTINVILMVVNVIPIPPLDGSKVMAGLLPGPMAYQYNRLEPYGFLILLALIATNVLGMIIGPAIEFVKDIILGLVGL